MDEKQSVKMGHRKTLIPHIVELISPSTCSIHQPNLIDRSLEKPNPAALDDLGFFSNNSFFGELGSGDWYA